MILDRLNAADLEFYGLSPKAQSVGADFAYSNDLFCFIKVFKTIETLSFTTQESRSHRKRFVHRFSKVRGAQKFCYSNALEPDL